MMLQLDCEKGDDLDCDECVLRDVTCTIRCNDKCETCSIRFECLTETETTDIRQGTVRFITLKNVMILLKKGLVTNRHNTKLKLVYLAVEVE